MMFDVLPYQLPWYVVGPLIGLCVVALYAIANKPLGSTSIYTQTIALVRGFPTVEHWRVWFGAGILVGGTVVGLLRAGTTFGLEYGHLTVLPLAVRIPVLLGAGVLIGY